MKKIAIFVLLALMVGCSKDPKAERDRYVKSGQEYVQARRYQEAIIQFRNALSLDGEHIPTLLGLGKSFQELGDNENAVGAFRRVLNLDGKNMEAKLQLGRYALTVSGKNPEMLRKTQSVAEEVLKADPTNIEARILLGNVYAKLDDLDKSIQVMKEVLQRDPANLSASITLGNLEMRRKNTGEARKIFLGVVQSHPDSTQAQLSLAAFYAASGESQMAENHFRKAFDLAPAEPLSLYSLVAFYVNSKREAEAEKVYREAIARKPEDREPRWGLTSFYLQRGKSKQGFDELQQLVKRNPADRSVQLRAADIFLSMNKTEAASALVESLLKANTNDAEAHYLRCRLNLIQGKTESALEEASKALELNRGILPAYLVKSNLLMSRGDFDGAQSSLNELLKRDKKNVSAQGMMAKLLALQQRPADALQAAQAVLAVRPDNEDALVGRAEALLATGKPKDAKADFLQLCRLHPQNPLYRHRLGFVEIALNNPTQAMNEFRKALELKPDFGAAIDAAIALLMRGKRLDEATRLLGDLERAGAPKDVVAVYRGRLWSAKGDLDSAAGEYQRAIDINPNNYQAYILLSQASRQRRNLPEALKELDLLIARNNKFMPAFLLKAIYLAALNDVQGAMTNYRKVLAMDPENHIAANNLAWLMCEHNMNLQEALKLAQIAKKRAPEDPGVADTLGWIHYKMKNYVLAVNQLLFSVNNGSPGAVGYYHLGMAYAAKGDAMLARQTLRKALDLNPGLPIAQDARKALNSLP